MSITLQPSLSFSEKRARDAAFCVIDFETLAFPGVRAAEPWQVGVVRLEGGVCRTHWDRFLRPGNAEDLKKLAAFLPPGRAMRAFEEASFLHQIWPELKPLMEGALPVAHQIGTEKKWLAAAAPGARIGPWIDTLRLARKAWPGLASYALEDLVRRAALLDELKRMCPNRSFHDALFDAFAAALLLREILTLPAWRELSLLDLELIHK